MLNFKGQMIVAKYFVLPNNIESSANMLQSVIYFYTNPKNGSPCKAIKRNERNCLWYFANILIWWLRRIFPKHFSYHNIIHLLSCLPSLHLKHLDDTIWSIFNIPDGCQFKSCHPHRLFQENTYSRTLGMVLIILLILWLIWLFIN